MSAAHQTKKLVVLTREEGKNDKLRERLQQGQAADQVGLDDWDGDVFEDLLVLKLVRNEKIHKRDVCSLQSCDAGSQVELMELPCIAHVLGEDHSSLGPTLDSQHFDYVVVTSPEVRERRFIRHSNRALAKRCLCRIVDISSGAVDVIE